MRLLIGLLIVTVVIGFILVRGGKGDYWSNPSQWNRTIQKTWRTTVRESGEQQELTSVRRREQTDMVGPRALHTELDANDRQILFGGAERHFDYKVKYDDGGWQRGSLDGDMIHRGRKKAASGTEQDFEGPLPRENKLPY
jgi:hypothetical protein